MILWLLLIFVVAAIYSSTGLGGLPTLLAILVLMPFSSYEVKILALTLNIIVVGINLILAQRVQLSKISDAIIALLCAVPSAMFTAHYSLSDGPYFMILGLIFILTSMYLFIKFSTRSRKEDKSSLVLGSILIGGIVGATGLAGGVLLLPILAANQWKDNEEISFFTSIFVLITSGIVIFLHYKSGSSLYPMALVNVISVTVLGTIVGRRIEVTFLNADMLRNITALFLFFMGIKLLYENYESSLSWVTNLLKL